MRTYEQYLAEQKGAFVANQFASVLIEHNIDLERAVDQILEDLIAVETDPERLRLLHAFYSEDAQGFGAKIGGMWGGFKSGVRNFAQGFKAGHDEHAPQDMRYGARPDAKQQAVNAVQQAMQALQSAGFGKEVTDRMQNVLQAVQAGGSAPAAPATPSTGSSPIIIPPGSDIDARKTPPTAPANPKASLQQQIQQTQARLATPGIDPAEAAELQKKLASDQAQLAKMP